jgi:hypothetical protein
MTVQSSITLYDLKFKVSKVINVHPDSVHIQYRLSTEARNAFPCDLITHVQFGLLIERLRPIIVPPRLANGRRPKRRKNISVILFQKSDGNAAAAIGKKVNGFMASIYYN